MATQKVMCDLIYKIKVITANEISTETDDIPILEIVSPLPNTITTKITLSVAKIYIYISHSTMIK